MTVQIVTINYCTVIICPYVWISVVELAVVVRGDETGFQRSSVDEAPTEL